MTRRVACEWTKCFLEFQTKTFRNDGLELRSSPVGRGLGVAPYVEQANSFFLFGSLIDFSALARSGSGCGRVRE